MIIFSFSKPTSWKPGAELIKLVEGTEFSHSVIRWNSNSLQRELIYQASGKGGVDFISKSRFDDHNKIVVQYAVNETQEQKNKVMQYCIDNAGDDYAYLQLLGIAWARVMKYFKRKVSNPFSQGQVCCEVTLRILADAFQIPIDPNQIDNMGLKDLENILIEQTKNSKDWYLLANN